MTGVRVKPGVLFTTIAPAGFRFLSAIDTTARRLGIDLTITCACEAHPPTDPHTTGEAFDVRSHGLRVDQQRAVLRELVLDLSDDADVPIETSGGLATRHFFGQLEAAGQPHEHFHIQKRQRTTYP